MAIGSSKDAAGKLKAARNPFMGKTRAQMKKMYDEKIRNSGKSGKALREIANQMQAALKAAPKVKKTAPTAKSSKPAKSTPTSTSRPNQTVNGASLGSKLTAKEKDSRAKAASPEGMTEKKGASPSRVSGRRFQSSPSGSTTSRPRRTRAQNRRSSSTSQSRSASARQRGLEKNRREAKAAERRRAFSSGTFKSSYDRR